MTNEVPENTQADAESLATKFIEFWRTLSAPEQALLWQALNRSLPDDVQGYITIDVGAMLMLRLTNPLIPLPTPSTPTVREAAPRTQTHNNLRQL